MFTSETQIAVQPAVEVPYIGLKIIAADFTYDDADAKEGSSLTLTFEDKSSLTISDSQQCCERRYMTTDDDIESLEGHILVRVDEKYGPTNGYHEICFIEIGTDIGFITITNHNEHNGYYSSFGLCLEYSGEVAA